MFGVLRGIVGGLGFGSQVMLALSLLVAAFYVYRAVGVARIVTGVLGRLTREALVLLVAGAVVIGLGWASPNVGTVLAHLHLVAREGVDAALGPGRRLVRWAVSLAA